MEISSKLPIAADNKPSIWQELLQMPKLYYFLFFSLMNIGFSYFINKYYATESVFLSTYSNQMTSERIEQMVSTGKKYAYIGYMIIPLFFLLRLWYNTLFLSIGNFMAENKFRLKQSYNIILKGEIVYLAFAFARIIFIAFFQDIKNLNDLNIIPFSLNHLLAGTGVPKWSEQALSYVNIFEVAYVFVYAKMLGHYNGKRLRQNLITVAFSYGAGLLLWCIALTYFIIVFS